MADEDVADSFFVQALYTYSGQDVSSLSFEKGDVIEILTELDSGWWDGVLIKNGERTRGWLPSNHVQRISDEEAVWARQGLGNAALHEGHHQSDHFDDADVDALLGRRTSRLAGSSLLYGNGDRNDSFSMGGNILAEIAAASVAEEPDQSDRRSIASSKRSIPASQIQHRYNSYWVPKSSMNGQVYFENTQTGETASDLPLDTTVTSSMSWPSSDMSIGFSHSPTEPIRKSSTSVKLPDASSSLEDHSSALLRHSSQDSTDSAVDAIMSPRSLALAVKQSSRSSVSPSNYTASDDLNAPMPPTLQDLEKAVEEAMQHLLQALQKDENIDMRLHTSALAEKTDCLVESIRALVHSTGVVLEVENASRNPPVTPQGAAPPFGLNALRRGSAVSITPQFPHGEFRRYTRRINAVLSKLVLSVRAAWGGNTAVLFADSPNNEAALHNQIRSNVDGVKVMIDELVTEIQRYSGRAGLPASKSKLKSSHRPVAAFESSADAAILPANFGGQDKAYGFVSLPASEPIPLAEPKPIISYSYPSRHLDSSVINDLNTSKSRWVSALSGFDAQIPIALNLIDTMLESLRQFLSYIEEIDLVSSIDVILSPQELEALYGITPARNSREHMDALVNEAKAYGALTRNSQMHLKSLRSHKSSLQSSLAQIFIAAQTFHSEHEISTNPPTPNNPSQPSFSSPLSAFSYLAPAISTTSESLSLAFAAVNNDIDSIIAIFTALLASSKEQQDYPPELRRPANDLRRTILHARNNAENAVFSNYSFPALQASTSVSKPKSYTPSDSIRSDDIPETLDNRFIRNPSPASATSTNSYVFPGTLTGPQSYPMASRTSTMQSLSRSQGPLDRPDSSASMRSGRSRSSSLSDSLRSMNILRTNKTKDRETLSRTPEDTIAEPTRIISGRTPKNQKLAQFFGEAPPMDNDELSPWLGSDVPPSQVTLSEQNSQIVGATLFALIANLTSHTGVDSTFNTPFFLTYRTFVSSEELLQKLSQRYHAPPPNDLPEDLIERWFEAKQNIVKIRVVNSIKTWISDFFMEDDDDVILRRLSGQIVQLFGNDVNAQQISRSIERRIQTGKPRRMTATLSTVAPAPPLMPRNLKKIKLLDIEPLEIARQLTLMDSKLFCKITPNECLAKAWPKQYGKESPNIKAMIDFNNIVTWWVMECIVNQADLRKRIATVKHFVSVAEKCLTLNNFSGLKQIIAGIESTPVHRLKRTLDAMPQRSVQTLAQLSQLMSPNRSHAEYRAALSKVGSPCVPFLGVYLSFWTAIGEGTNNMMRDKPDQINFSKRRTAAELVQQIQLHQSTPYNLAPAPALITWLEDGFHSPIEDRLQVAYQKSLEIEPREREDEKIARLLSESGFL